jgi:flagellar hook-associated protein 3 FlgL
MRITAFTIFNGLTRSLNENLKILGKLSGRLSSGKKLSKPSDDVSSMGRSMDYKVTLNEIEQYRRNIAEVESHISIADSTMSSVTNSLIRARELAVQASSSTQSATSRAAIAEEIENLRDEMLNLANTKFRNRYIFSGFQTDTAAFDSGFNYQGDAGQISVKIDRNATMDLNIVGSATFSVNGATFMEHLDDFYSALMANDENAIQDAITNVDNALDHTANVRADLGSRLTYVDDLKLNLDNRDFTLKTLLSNVEDNDIAETASEIAKTELALESLRQSGSRILQQSLLDFLR